MLQLSKSSITQKFFELRDALVAYPDAVVARVSMQNKKFFTVLGVLAAVLTLLLRLHATTLVRDKKETGKVILKEGVKERVYVIHPILINVTQTDRDIKFLLYRRLLTLSSTGQVLPDLLAAWKTSAGGKKYTFYLRKDARWSDNTPITARDVLFTFNVIKRYYAETSSAQLLKTAKITSPSDYIVRLEFEAPVANLWDYLDFPIMAQHYYESYNPDQLLYEGFLIPSLSSGNYILKEYTPRRVLLVKRHNPAPFKEIEFISTKINNWQSLIARDITSLSDITLEEEQKLAGVPYITVHHFIKYYDFVGFFINSHNLNPLLRDQEFRYALYKLIDRNQLAKLLGTQPAYSIYHQNSQFYNEPVVQQYLNKNIDVKGILKRIPKRKHEYCKKAFNTEYCHLIVLTVPKNPEFRLIAETLRERLQKLGIGVHIKEVNRTQLHGEIIPMRDYEMLLLTLSTNVDPDQYVFWHSSQTEYPGKNIVGLQSRRADRYLIRGRILTNPQERAKEYQKLQEVLFEYMYFVPLIHPVYRYAYLNDVIKIEGEAKFVVEPQQRFLYIKPLHQGWQRGPIGRK